MQQKNLDDARHSYFIPDSHPSPAKPAPPKPEAKLAKKTLSMKPQAAPVKKKPITTSGDELSDSLLGKRSRPIMTKKPIKVASSTSK